MMRLFDGVHLAVVRRVCLTMHAGVLITLLCACSADPGYEGRSSRTWIAQLRDTSVVARTEAAQALDRILALNPKDQAATDALIRALGDTADRVRLAAGIALTNQGVLAAGAIPQLSRIAGDSAHPLVRALAVQLLGAVVSAMPSREVEPIAVDLTATLARALRDPVADVRQRAVVALAQVGPPAARSEEAMRELARLARDRNPRLRAEVLRAVDAVDASPSVAIAVAGHLLGDSVISVRQLAAHTLGASRPFTEGASALLIAALEDDASSVRVAATVALGAATPLSARAESALRSLGDDEDSLVRREAQHALEQFHRRGGRDPRPTEPSQIEKCRSAPRGTLGC